MAITGMGTVFKRSTDGGTTYTDVGNIKNIAGPGLTKGTRDVTTLSSADDFREFIGTLKDPGEVTLTMEFDHDGYNTMLTDYNTDSLLDYQIVLPDASSTTFSFQAIVTGIPLTIAEDAVTYTVTLKLSGPVTVA